MFVDAGYLYAQGSALLHGKKLGREWIQVEPRPALECLETCARTIVPHGRLLRIYWYDGLLQSGRLSVTQELIGQSENTKLRLGLVNSKGEQKEVDALIVTDLIDLARNRAITDALILSGDGDIKIGVQVAQTFGVRVHLLGIKPAEGSQSPALRMESDTCREWDRVIVGQVLKIISRDEDWSRPSIDKLQTNAGQDDGKATVPHSFSMVAAAEINARIHMLSSPELDQHLRYMKANNGRIHPDIDRPALAGLRRRLDRDVTDAERMEYRRMFRESMHRSYRSRE